MTRAMAHLLLLLAVLGYTSGAALAAHEAVAGHDHHHVDRDCPVYHTLISHAVDAPAAPPAFHSDPAPRYTLTPVNEAAHRIERITPAQPRAPPVG